MNGLPTGTMPRVPERRSNCPRALINSCHRDSRPENATSTESDPTTRQIGCGLTTVSTPGGVKSYVVEPRRQAVSAATDSEVNDKRRGRGPSHVPLPSPYESDQQPVK